MIWSTHLRCAAVALFAMAVSYAVSAWAIPSARAFTMENLSTGGNTTRFDVTRESEGRSRLSLLRAVRQDQP